MAEVLKLVGSTTSGGTAQAGAASSITLANAASATDDAYNNLVVEITGGTGAGQANIITNYTGSTRLASVMFPWSTQPDSSSVYAVGELTLTSLFDVRRDLTIPVGRGDETIISTMTIVSRGGRSVARANMATLDYLLDVASGIESDPLQEQEIRFVVATDGEGERWAVVVNFERLTDAAGGAYGGALLLTANGRSVSQLAITHRPLESAGTISYSVANISLHGGTTNTLDGGLTAISNGTLPGRIAELRVNGDNANSGVIERLWVGIRPSGRGYSGFDPVIECEDYFSLGTDAAVVADANASGGSAVQVTFATATAMSDRLQVQLGGAVSGDVRHYKGSYLVLCRYQVTTSGTEVGLRLAGRWDNLSDERAKIQLATQYLSYTSGYYRVAELGILDIPPSLRPPANAYVRINEFKFQFEAERNAGSGNLRLDNIWLIPARHRLYIENLYLQAASTTTAYITQDGVGQMRFSTNAGAGTTLTSGEVAATNWQLPVDGGTFVFVGERADRHILTDQMALVQPIVAPRWMSYRA